MKYLLAITTLLFIACTLPTDKLQLAKITVASTAFCETHNGIYIVDYRTFFTPYIIVTCNDGTISNDILLSNIKGPEVAKALKDM